ELHQQTDIIDGLPNDLYAMLDRVQCAFSFMVYTFRLMGFFPFSERYDLWHILIAVFAVIVCPSFHRRDFTRPVPMRSIDRCGPFQSIGFVWVLGGYLASAPHTVEKIDDK